MKNLKVGAKVMLGFGIVVLMMLVTLVTVWVSSTLTINNSRHVDVITTLQGQVNTVTAEFLEARAQANILYGSHSNTAFDAFAAMALQTDETFLKILEFIKQNDEVSFFAQDISAGKQAFDKWAEAVNSLQEAHLKKAEAYDTYVALSEKLVSLAGGAFAGELNSLKVELAVEDDTNTLFARTKQLAVAQQLQVDILEINIESVDFGHVYDQEAFDHLVEALDALIESIKTTLEKEEVNSANVAIMNYISAAVVSFRQAALDFGELSREVEQLSAGSVPLGYTAGDLFDATERKMAATVDDVVSETINSANFYMILVVAISLTSAALAIIIAMLTARSITIPLKFLSEYMTSVANTGDLTLVAENHEKCQLYSKHRDEVGATVLAANSLFDMMEYQGQILKDIANKDISKAVVPRSEKSTVGMIAIELLDELNEVMSKIHESSVQVSGGARHIADGAQALASGSTQQATAVEHLSMSISSVSEKSKDNSALAERAASLGDTIRKSAERSSAQMNSMVQAVNEISEASQNISKVIGVIDSIAFQTNILALNAAVEAARAGQHGKGFAVVAEEVRSLASKSAAAAKDTGSMISSSIEKAELGAKLASETAASLAEIVTGIQESSKIVNDIARSSNEQTNAITEIDNGITQVAKVVQQNSATSEQSAAAAQEMSRQSETLAALTQEFTLRESSKNLVGSSQLLIK